MGHPADFLKEFLSRLAESKGRVHDKKVIGHAALRSVLRSQKS